MNKRKKLEIQLFSSIGFATLIIISSSVYFFIQLSRFLQQNEEIIANTLQQTSYANQLESELFRVIQYKVDYLASKQYPNIFPTFPATDQIRNLLTALENSAVIQDNTSIHTEFRKLNDISSQIIDNHRFSESITNLPKEQVALSLLSEQTRTKTILDKFIDEILVIRQTKLTESRENIL